MKSLDVETTVVSYYTACPSRDLLIAARQESTRQLWPRLSSDYECFVSELVREEAGKGDKSQAGQRLDAIASFATLGSDDESETLAEAIVQGGGIPEKYPEDALHVAIAAINGIDVLVTWNFAHLNNPFTRLMLPQIVENAGYECPEICSPDELLELEL